ncbi:hypothetical protein [Pedobacter psychrodurus]|nr:hypothetical protein [Pedobacter psychrodurus]
MSKSSYSASTGLFTWAPLLPKILGIDFKFRAITPEVKWEN